MSGKFYICAAETGKKAKYVATLPTTKLFRLQSLDCAKTDVINK